jgi:uncharacterized membrane protein
MTQVVVCVLVGLLVATVMILAGQRWAAPLVGWDATALTYVVWTWANIGRLDASRTATHAVIPDPTRRGADLIVLLASAVSLIAVAFVIARAGHAHGSGEIFQTVLGIGSVVVSWVVVHTTYTVRYATLYHTGRLGGIDFNQDDPPTYADFGYVAFTIGMTFQVSDTSFTSSAMRSTALRHGLLSYLFGTIIIATAINMIAGLAH